MIVQICLDEKSQCIFCPYFFNDSWRRLDFTSGIKSGNGNRFLSGVTKIIKSQCVVIVFDNRIGMSSLSCSQFLSFALYNGLVFNWNMKSMQWLQSLANLFRYEYYLLAYILRSNLYNVWGK